MCIQSDRDEQTLAALYEVMENRFDDGLRCNME